jgi:hypothetical protein
LSECPQTDEFASSCVRQDTTRKTRLISVAPKTILMLSRALGRKNELPGSVPNVQYLHPGFGVSDDILVASDRGETRNVVGT